MEFEAAEEQHELLKKIEYFKEVQFHYNRLLNYALNKEYSKNKKNVSVTFCGANMVSRAYETAIVGGVPEEEGNEDPQFGERLAEIGKIEFSPEIKTFPANRESARTAIWAGHGQGVIKALKDYFKQGEAKVDGYKYSSAKNNFTNQLTALKQEGKTSPNDIKRLFVIEGKQLISEEEIEYISWKISNMISRDELREDPKFTDIGIKFSEKRREFYPWLTLDEAKKDLFEELLKDEQLAVKYNYIINEKTKSINLSSENSESELLQWRAMHQAVRDVLKID